MGDPRLWRATAARWSQGPTVEPTAGTRDKSRGSTRGNRSTTDGWRTSCQSWHTPLVAADVIEASPRLGLRAASIVLGCVLIVTGLTGGGPSISPPSSSASPSASLPPAIDVAPIPWSRIGPVVHPFPRTLDISTARLGGRQPGHRVIALLAPADPADTRIVSLLNTGQLVALPWRLQATRDKHGNLASPLGTRAISPDGVSAAFAQPDAVVVYNMDTGARRSFVVPGFNESAVWVDDHIVAVGTEAGTRLVDVASAAVRPASYAGNDSVFQLGPLAELSSQGGARGLPARATYRSLEGAGRGVSAQDVGGVVGWRGAAFSSSPLIARVGFIDGFGELEAAVIVLEHGEVHKRLRFPSAPWSAACCEVLGWRSDGAVVLSASAPSGTQFLLSWRIDTGELIPFASSETQLRMSLAPGY